MIIEYRFGLSLIVAALAYACSANSVLAKEASTIRHKGVTTIALSSDGALLASAGGGEIRIWEVDTGNLLSRIDGHVYSPIRFDGPNHPIDGTTGLAFIRGNSRLVSSGKDGNIKVTSIETGITELTIAEPWIYNELDPVSWGPRSYLRVPIDDMAVSHDESQIAAVVFDTVQVWRLNDGELIGSFGMDQSRIEDLPIATIIEEAGLVDSDETRSRFLTSILRFPEDMSGQCTSVSRWQGRLPFNDGLHSIEFSPDHRFIGVGGSRSVHLWSMPGFELVQTHSPANWIAFLPDNSHVVVGHRFGSIEIRQIESGELVREYEGEISSIASVTGAIECLVKSQGRVRVLNFQTGELSEVQLEVDGKEVLACAISADGRFVAACWHDWGRGEIRIVDRERPAENE